MYVRLVSANAKKGAHKQFDGGVDGGRTSVKISNQSINPCSLTLRFLIQALYYIYLFQIMTGDSTHIRLLLELALAGHNLA